MPKSPDVGWAVFVNGPFLVIFKPVQKVVQNSTAEKKTMEYAFFKKMQFVIEQ